MTLRVTLSYLFTSEVIMTHNISQWHIYRGVPALFFYEILVAASAECSSRIVEVASCYEIS